MQFSRAKICNECNFINPVEKETEKGFVPRSNSLSNWSNSIFKLIIPTCKSKLFRLNLDLGHTCFDIQWYQIIYFGVIQENMRKRERENPCGICGHYHKYEEGEVCGICGHRMPDDGLRTSIQVSAFPSEILPEFLYLGSYDNASRSELLKTQGISHVLNVSFFFIWMLISRV